MPQSDGQTDGQNYNINIMLSACCISQVCVAFAAVATALDCG